MKKQINLETEVKTICPLPNGEETSFVCPMPQAKVPELEILNPQVEDFTVYYNWLPK